jgi:hypothetical protein
VLGLGQELVLGQVPEQLVDKLVVHTMNKQVQVQVQLVDKLVVHMIHKLVQELEKELH